MNRMFLVATMLCVLGLAGVAIAQDPLAGDVANADCNCSPVGDPWNYVPQPSGLRFIPAGGGNGMPCCASYNYCWAEGGCAVCSHWTQHSWYAPWPHGPCLEKPYKKHQWLH